jgi:hypothetical protein
MKNSHYFFLSLQVLLIFAVLIFASLIPDIFPKFFGDWFCNGRTKFNENVASISHCTNGQGYHSSTWHWGYRHWLFMFMGLCLFVIQVIRLIQYINAKTSEK